MKQELDNKYLVLKNEDIATILNSSELRSFNMAIKKINMARSRNGKLDKKYVVVSDSCECFSSVTTEVLNEINGIKPLYSKDKPNTINLDKVNNIKKKKETINLTKDKSYAKNKS